MSKYTLGPYEKVESDIIGEYLIYPPMITSSTGHIAEVHGDNADANANLFVVAPETAAERDRLRESNLDYWEALTEIADFVGKDDVVTINTIVTLARTVLDRNTFEKYQTERDRLRGALKDARAKLVFPFVAHDAEDAVRIIDAALAEPESGEKREPHET